MITRKKAFSLMELLMIVVVLGIIASLFVKMVRVDTITTKYTTYAAWQNIYNIIDELQNEQRLTDAKNPQVFPIDNNFCKASAKLVSTIDETVDCASSSVPSSPNYTFSNGMQFFGLQPGLESIPGENNISGVNGGEDPNLYSYRTVFIDLNGASDPDAVDSRLTTAVLGTAAYGIISTDASSNSRNTRSELPDIIAFRIYNDYQVNHHASVVPLGIAANDKRYLTARIKVTSSDTGDVKFVEGSYTYRDAECAAYGATRSDAPNASANNRPSGGIVHEINYRGAVNCDGRLPICKKDGNYCQLVVVRPSGAF